MRISDLITGEVGLLTTITSAWASWFFTRKKYKSEVDHSLIDNMENSLEFYKKLSDDNSARLEELAERNKELEVSLHELREQVFNLTTNICIDLTCTHRVREKTILNKKEDAESSDRLDETKEISRG